VVATASEKVNNNHFTDCHCHLIPGLDDGPSNITEALEMARILSDFGFSKLFCTPHQLKGAFDNHPSRIREAVTDFQEILHRENIPLTTHAAVEYHLDEYLQNALDEPMLIGEDLILLEAHRHIQPQTLSETVYWIITRKKLRPLLAHPERYDLFDDALNGKQPRDSLITLWPWQWNRHGLRSRGYHPYRQESEDLLTVLREMGCLFQGNIGSFAGIYGGRVRKRAISLLKMGIYDRLGTDAHRPQHLAVWLEEGLKVIKQAIGREGLTRLLRPLEASI
jgi:protein-tyrosine phosphatase